MYFLSVSATFAGAQAQKPFLKHPSENTDLITKSVVIHPELQFIMKVNRLITG